MSTMQEGNCNMTITVTETIVNYVNNNMIKKGHQEGNGNVVTVK